MEEERELLMDPSMRTDVGGGCRAKAKDRSGKRHAGNHTYGNKRQRQVYTAVLLTRGQSYTQAELYSRGKASLKRECDDERAALAERANAVPERRFKSLKTTNGTTAGGRARGQIAPPLANAGIAPQGKEAGGRGTGRSAAAIAARKKAVQAQKKQVQL